MEVLILFYLLLSALILALSLSLGCGPNQADMDVTPTETAVADVEPDVEPTKEYLASLPLWECQQAQWKLNEQRQEELKHDARKQAEKWIKESQPDCQHFFGSGNCNPAFVELQPSEICGFKFHRPLSSIEEVQAEGHYFVALVGADGHQSGGYVWIASYGHQAHMDGTVLNITDCWGANPSEIGATPRPTYTPGPTSIFNDWQGRGMSK